MESSNNSASEDESDVGANFSSFAEALHRTVAEDARTHSHQLESLLKERVKQQDADATHIYLQKEINAVKNKSQFDDITIAQLEKDIKQLQICVTNKTAASSICQNAYISTQLQTALQSSLPDGSSHDDISPQMTAIMDNSNKDLEETKKLAKVLDEIDEKKRLLGEKRRKLVELQRKLRQLWEDKENRDLRRTRTEDTPEIIAARDKLKARESRLQLIIHFLQTLIPVSSNRWGTDEKLLRVMEACEMYLSNPTGADCDAIAALL